MPPCHGGGRGFESRPVRKKALAYTLGLFAFMAFYVYIIQSEKDGRFYKGFSENPVIRLCQHNAGETASTMHLCPWKLVYVEEFHSKSEALIREKNLKKATRERIIALLTHEKNMVNLFGSVG